MDADELRGEEPAVWVLAFHRETKIWWLRWVGRYKHVCAYAFLPRQKLWLFYEVSTDPTRITVIPDGAEREKLALFTGGADLMAVRCQGARPKLRRRFAFTCVAAMRDLLGLDSGALLPSGLWRDCLAAGGQTLGRIDPTISAAATERSGNDPRANDGNPKPAGAAG